MNPRAQPSPLESIAVLSLLLLATPAPSWAQDADGASPGAPSPAASKLLAACSANPGQRAIPTGAYVWPAHLARGFESPDFRPARTLDELRRALPGTETSSPRRADLLWDLGLAWLWLADAAAEPQRAEARAEATKTLAILARDHPQYQRRDHALYLLGRVLMEQAAGAPRENERSEQAAQQARRVYFELIKSFPTSRLVPHAYVQFGDYYFDRGDLESASTFYERVLQFPAPANPVYGYALYRLAWSRLNQQDRLGAAARFADLLQYAARNPNAPEAGALARRAELEICLAR
jgi:tetratricopeptide (TPR) repeat protein